MRLGNRETFGREEEKGGNVSQSVRKKKAKAPAFFPSFSLSPSLARSLPLFFSSFDYFGRVGSKMKNFDPAVSQLESVVKRLH